MAKSNAERGREFRERQKKKNLVNPAEKVTKKRKNSESTSSASAKTPAERMRVYRARKKILQNNLLAPSSTTRVFTHTSIMPRQRTLTGRSEKQRRRDIYLRTHNNRPSANINSLGNCLQDVTCRDTLYPSEEKPSFLHSSSIDPVPVIKTEILDPSEENQEFILPDHLQCATSVDPMSVVDTEIQDTYKSNKFLLPNIKVEQTEINYTFDEPSRTEELFEKFTNNETENSSTVKYELTECSVLLHDCLIPENLASLSARYKSLKIITDISETFLKIRMLPLSDTPLFPHISEAYKKMAFSTARRKRRQSRPYYQVHSYDTKMVSDKRKSKKITCNCYKAEEDAMISLGSQFYESSSDSSQQLCSCLISDYMLSEPIEMETSLFNPDFGKITCGINKIN